MPERIGGDTVGFANRPTILGYAAVGGKKEGEGPLGKYFDAIFEDVHLGCDTWEQAESALQKEALTRAVDKTGLSKSQLQVLFAGDLLNQNIASTFGLRDMEVPLIGQFGACSTMGQTLALAALFVDSGAADLCGAVTSSHFCTAERQFRFPLEYGGQRPPTSQWTATASGACVVGRGGHGVWVDSVCFGRVCDLGVTDANNMGAAMAPVDGRIAPYRSRAVHPTGMGFSTHTYTKRKEGSETVAPDFENRHSANLAECRFVLSFAGMTEKSLNRNLCIELSVQMCYYSLNCLPFCGKKDDYEKSLVFASGSGDGGRFVASECFFGRSRRNNICNE